MPNASSTYTDTVYKAETTYGVLPGAATGQSLRRVSLTMDIEKETFESNEQRTDLQVADFRHGARSAVGKLSGELSPGSYSDFFAALFKRDWASPADITALSVTIAVSGLNYTITRSAGDFLTNIGIVVGAVWRFSAGGLNANNLNKRFVILNATALVLTVLPINNSAMTAEGPIAGCTLTFPGKRNYNAVSNPLNKSFSLEKFYSDIVQSEVFTGVRPTQVAVKLPASGLVTVDFDLVGQNMTPNGARYFTSPLVALGTPLLAAVNGVTRAGGQIVANITGMDFMLMSPQTAEAVVGSNVKSEPFSGRMRVSGNFTALFDSVAMRDAFLNETEFELIALMTADNSNTSNFISFVMPRCKVGKAGKSDQTDAGISQTFSFVALLNTAGGAGAGVKSEYTTLWMQDSAT